METLITKRALHTTENLAQTAAALARLLDQVMNDIQAVDIEFQEQVQEAVRQTEAYVEQQDAERVKLAVKDAELNTRTRLTAELEARFNGERAAAVEAVRDELTAERDQLRQELDRLQNEHERALAETDEAASIALERQIATAIDRVRAELTNECDRLRQELEQARHAVASAPVEQRSLEIGAVDEEVTRVEGLIQNILRVVEDPDTELSTIIRKNVERTELEAYIRGLRFRTP